jgi:exodeoxyribonuclease-1
LHTKIQASLYWYDYETFGVDPRRDRPAQFAGIRTDLELNVIGQPLTLYCRPSDDFLPNPESCLITGITPQKLLAEGIPEAEFICRILQEFSQPQTCIVGYNNIRFDDEVTRFTLYRNLYDAYAHEWKNGNSRWDIIDTVRLTHALRPEGIQWPRNGDGRTTFRLDQLTTANRISHASAHDALSDVLATIEVARLIKRVQPKLYDYVFNHRSKQSVIEQLTAAESAPVLHVSSMYPVELGCIAPVIPLATHPSNKNEVLVYDLRVDPREFLALDIEEIRARLFTKEIDLSPGQRRLPVKSIHINKCPILVPAATLTPAAAQAWSIDMTQAAAHRQLLLAAPHFVQSLLAAYDQRERESNRDPDFMLYDGGFFSQADRERMERVHRTRPEDLADLRCSFEDKRLPEMLFRFRARNYPETLNAAERQDWIEFRRSRLIDGMDSTLSYGEFAEQIDHLRASASITEHQKKVLDALDHYGRELMASL